MKSIIFIAIMVIVLIIMLRMENKMEKHYARAYDVGGFFLLAFLGINLIKYLAVSTKNASMEDAGWVAFLLYAVILAPFVYSCYLSVKCTISFRSALKPFLLILALHSFIVLIYASVMWGQPGFGFNIVFNFLLKSLILPVILIGETRLVLLLVKSPQELEAEAQALSADEMQAFTNNTGNNTDAGRSNL